MIFRVTNVGKPKQIRGGQIAPINVTADGCAATLTTRYDAVGTTNILTLAHYPMTVVLVEHDL